MRLDTNRILPAYLCYALNGNVLAAQLERKARGAIMDGLNTTILRECVVPLPTIVEQRRIAAQLEQADRLRRIGAQTVIEAGNLKQAAPPLPADAALLETWRQRLGHRSFRQGPESPGARRHAGHLERNRRVSFAAGKQVSRLKGRLRSSPDGKETWKL
jgi:hypothetical protein